VSLQVLPPPGIPSWGQNNNSIGVLLEYGTFRLGLTGDAEPELFTWWYENVPHLMQPVHVYKSAHHGSEHGDTPLSMDRFRPEVVVIGVGANNRYGHPTDRALRLYAAVGADVYRTDLHSTVIVYANEDGSYRIETERAAPTQPAQQVFPSPQEEAPAVQVGDCIDINTATLEQLQQILHLGEERAAQVIQLRLQRPFASVEELRRVEGIGPARLRDILEQGLACVP
jgi:competence protein ComEC